MIVFSDRITPPCVSVFLCVKVTVLLRKCQREHCPHSQDITAVKSLSTQTNLHCVSYILGPHSHSCSTPRAQQNKTFEIDIYLILLLFPCLQLLLPLLHKTCQFSEREDKRSICSGYKSGNYSSSWKIYKNLYLCEWALHHRRYQKWLQPQVLSSPVKMCVQLSCVPSWMQTTFSHVTEDKQECAPSCVFTWKRQPAEVANMRECLPACWLGFESYVCIKQRHNCHAELACKTQKTLTQSF